jgi:hypothetical protein
MAEDVEDDDGVSELEIEVSIGQVASGPGPIADPMHLVEACIPADILERYEVYSYRSAALVLSQNHKAEFEELIAALRAFSITTEMIRMPGGNESQIPKLFANVLRPLGWHETVIRADLEVSRVWTEQVRVTKGNKPVFETRTDVSRRIGFMDGHKIDFVKNRTAFDLEWNSKDQTFDRDLYAFNAFAQTGVIDVGVLLTRGNSLGAVISQLGPKLNKDGTESSKPTASKYGASTTWMGKLLYRLNAGRNGACPVLAFGIKPACISDWPPNAQPRN